MRVYIAGPYTAGDVAFNVARAIDAGMEVLDAGAFPFIPHLCHFMHLKEQRPYDVWTRYDLEWLRVCNAMLRLPGDSPGSDVEHTFAKDCRIPVFHSLPDILEHING